MLAARAWALYSRALDRFPLRTKASTAFVIFGLADSTRQYLERRGAPPQSHSAEAARAAWDVGRTVRLAGFYAVVHAPWVHYWFQFLERAVGASGVRAVVLKIAVDQTLSMPVFMATLLTTQALLQGRSLDYCRAKLQRDLIPTIQGAWMCWIPALAIAFRFVPLKYRLLYVNAVQVGFGVFISKQANAPVPHPDVPDTLVHVAEAHIHNTTHTPTSTPTPSPTLPSTATPPLS